MDSNVIFPRKLVKRFIQLYKDLPCLWDKKSFAYKHKQKRHDAISKLTQLVQEYDPTATRVHILRKIDSLRACVRREHNRVLESRRKAKSPEEIYVPTLWYYDSFLFFYSDEADNTPMKSDLRVNKYYVQQRDSLHTSKIATLIRAKTATVELAEDDEDEDTGDEDITYDFNNLVEVPESTSMSSRLCFEEDQNKSNKRLCTEIDDEYDAIGINVAAKLRALPPNMRILSEKLINDVLFQAQINALNSDTVITTTDPFKQDL